MYLLSLHPLAVLYPPADYTHCVYTVVVVGLGKKKEMLRISGRIMTDESGQPIEPDRRGFVREGMVKSGGSV